MGLCRVWEMGLLYLSSPSSPYFFLLSLHSCLPSYLYVLNDRSIRYCVCLRVKVNIPLPMFSIIRTP